MVTAWTTGVSNPIRYPCFCALASVMYWYSSSPIGVPTRLSLSVLVLASSNTTHITQVMKYCMLYTTLHQSRDIQLSLPPTHPVRPVMLTRTCTSRLTAYAGTSFTRCFLSFGVVSLSPMAGVYSNIDLLPPRCLLVRAISHSLTKSLHCSLHKESGQCLSSNMAVQNLPAQLSIIGLGCFYSRQLP